MSKRFLEANNIMVDIETMGKGTNAAIVAIGAAKFDESEVLDRFYMNVYLQSSIDAGMEVDGSTVMWWMRQSEEARVQLQCGKVLCLPDALRCLANWMRKRIDEFGEPVVWGNGADFDNAILKNAYRLCKMELPWSYKNNRCYRTIKAQRPDIEIKNDGVKHCAVDDAVSQAKHLIEIVNEVK